jgi:hypothetical protein
VRDLASSDTAKTSPGHRQLALETNPLIAPLFACLIGFALPLSLFPAGLIFGLPSYWDSVTGDNAANWIGYVAFARDDWRWPLFQTLLAAPPAGINILFTDPIPLLALLGKIVFKATGYLPNYFGFWLLASYMLQSLSAYALLRQLGFAGVPALLCSALFLLLPAFIFRYGHFPLVSHWVIIVQLMLYLRMVDGSSKPPLALGALFNLIMLLINPYLLAMTLTLYIASVIEAVLRKRTSVAKAALILVALIAILVGGALLFGFISYDGSGASGPGFGVYSMNLLSPVWPQLSAWPGQNTFILDATGGQYEGFNYLGGGILLLLLTALIAAPGQVVAFGRRYAFLLITCLALSAYAVSTQVYGGKTLLLEIPIGSFPPLAKLSEIFRSSGRFFWPMAYVLLLLGSVALRSRFGDRRLAVIAAVLVAVQWVDIQPLLRSVELRAAPVAAVIPKETWRRAVQRHDELVIFPQFLCNKPSNYTLSYGLQVLAAEEAKPTNSAMINRSNLDCQADYRATSQNLRALATRPNPLIAVFRDGFNAGFLARASAAAGMTCKEESFAYVCSGSSDPEQLGLGKALSAPLVAQPGELLEVGPGKRGAGFLGYGWTDAGARFVWGAGPDAALAVALSEPICGKAVLKARVLPFSAGAHKVDRAMIAINGGAATEYRLASMAEGDLVIDLQPSGCAQRFDVAFAFSGLKSPKELGVSGEPRRLSWALASFSIEAAQ